MHSVAIAAKDILDLPDTPEQVVKHQNRHLEFAGVFLNLRTVETLGAINVLA